MPFQLKELKHWGKIKQWFSWCCISEIKEIHPKRWKTIEVSPTIDPAYCLEWVARLQHREGQLGGLLELRKRAGSWVTSRQLVCIHTEKSVEVSLECSVAHVCENNYPDWKRNHWEWWEEAICNAHTGHRIFPIQNKNHRIETFPPNWGRISSRLNVAPILPNKTLIPNGPTVSKFVSPLYE